MLTHHTGPSSWCEFSLLGDGFYTVLYFLVSLVSFSETKTLCDITWGVYSSTLKTISQAETDLQVLEVVFLDVLGQVIHLETRDQPVKHLLASCYSYKRCPEQPSAHFMPTLKTREHNGMRIF